jgi:hypothetical protein
MSAANGALQTRDRYGPWRSRISDAPLANARAAPRPGHAIASDALVALFTFQTAHLVPAARFLRPGFATLLHSPRIEGWAERRETFGCVRGTRWACHLASKTRVNALSTRHARRLRGALRPMTRESTGRNNVTISMPDGGGVPIVSQTETEPMKTALSLMLALTTTTALAEPLPVPKPPGPGGSCPYGYIASGSFHAVVWRAGDDRQAAGTCPARERQLLPAQRLPSSRWSR